MTPEIAIIPDALNQIAQEEGIRLEAMPQQYQKYYRAAKKTRDRCVDDRVLTAEFQDFDLTPQLPGNHHSLIDVITQLAPNIEENDAAQLVYEALNDLGFSPTTHKHCGYLGLAGQDPSPLRIISQDQEARKTRVANQANGLVEEYEGEHSGSAKALMNAQLNTTFNSRQALAENNPAFNFDYWFAKQFGEQTRIKEITNKTGEDFANQVARLYFRTVKALANTEVVYFQS